MKGAYIIFFVCIFVQGCEYNNSEIDPFSKAVSDLSSSDDLESLVLTQIELDVLIFLDVIDVPDSPLTTSSLAGSQEDLVEDYTQEGLKGAEIYVPAQFKMFELRNQLLEHLHSYDLTNGEKLRVLKIAHDQVSIRLKDKKEELLRSSIRKFRSKPTSNTDKIPDPECYPSCDDPPNCDECEDEYLSGFAFCNTRKRVLIGVV